MAFTKRCFKPSATDSVSNNFAATLSNRVPMKVVRNNLYILKNQQAISAGRRALWRAAIKQILTAIKLSLRNMIFSKSFFESIYYSEPTKEKGDQTKMLKTIVLSRTIHGRKEKEGQQSIRYKYDTSY